MELYHFKLKYYFIHMLTYLKLIFRRFFYNLKKKKSKKTQKINFNVKMLLLFKFKNLNNNNIDNIYI